MSSVLLRLPRTILVKSVWVIPLKIRGYEFSRWQSKLSYVHGASENVLKYETIGQMLRRSVEAHPERNFLIFTKQGIRKTYKDFYADVKDLKVIEK